MATDLETALQESYQGEVLGQAFFEALAQTSDSPEAKEKWGVLARLEEVTKERLRPFVAKDVSEDPDQISRGTEAARGYAEQDWPAQMRSMQPVLEGAINNFEGYERLAGPDTREVCAALTAHERALLTFTERELAGEADSLADVRACISGRRRPRGGPSNPPWGAD